MSKKTKTISYSYIEPLLDYITSNNIILADELSHLHTNPGKHLPLSQYEQLVAIILDNIHFSELALDIIQQTEMTRHDMLGLLVMCGLTLKQALKAMLKFYRIQIKFILLNFEEDKTYGTLKLTPDGLQSPADQFTLFMGILAIIKAKQDLIGFTDEQDIIHIPFTLPDNIKQSALLENCIIKENQPFFAIGIPQTSLKTKLKSANQISFELLQKQCEQILASQSPNEATDTRVVQLLKQIKDTFPDLSQMASLLAMSSRTLSRQLKDHNTSYQILLDTEKVNRSKELLKFTDLSITEIANQLYFSDSSYFTKVFKKNVGLSPSAYRKMD